jgi:hypothetical protein
VVRRSAGTFFELAALATTTAYVFWRWADHASYGRPLGFALAVHAVIAGVLSIGSALVVRRWALISPLSAVVTGTTLAVCLCHIANTGQDLLRFQAIGGPVSKEMRELAWHKHIAAEATQVFYEATALRIRGEFCFTGLIVLLVLAYLSRSSKMAKDVREEARGASAPP